jgi:hypothetical protein
MDFDYTTETITLDNTNILTVGGTGAVALQSGTTAQRPTPTNGLIRYNTDLTALEAYIGGTWASLGTANLSYVIEDVSTTTYTFVAADQSKIKRFTNASGCSATIPASLGTGWNCLWERSSAAGSLTFVASSTTLRAANGSGSLVASVGFAGAVIPEATDVYQISGELGTAVAAAYVVEDVSTTTYTFVAADLSKLKRFTNASGCTATIPASLGTGWNCLWETSSGAGALTFAASSTTLRAANGSGSLIASVGEAGAIIPEATDVYLISGQLGPGAIILPAGTTSLTPLTYASGTNLTTVAAGNTEFDGVNFYQTIDTTSGRGAVPVEQYFHLTAAGSNISTIANFFGTTSNISLVANAYYEIEIVCFFLKTTANTVTWTFTNSSAPTSQNIYLEMSPLTGIVNSPTTNTLTTTMLIGQWYNDTTAARTITTGSLTTAVNHYARFRIWLRNGSGTNLKIQATANTSGSITPGINSWWRCVRRSPNNIGTFAA